MANMTLHQVKKTLNEGNKDGQVKLSFHLKMIKVNGQVRGCSGFVENTENFLSLLCGGESSAA